MRPEVRVGAGRLRTARTARTAISRVQPYIWEQRTSCCAALTALEEYVGAGPQSAARDDVPCAERAPAENAELSSAISVEKSLISGISSDLNRIRTGRTIKAKRFVQVLQQFLPLYVKMTSPRVHVN